MRSKVFVIHLSLPHNPDWMFLSSFSPTRYYRVDSHRTETEERVTSESRIGIGLVPALDDGGPLIWIILLAESPSFLDWEMLWFSIKGGRGLRTPGWLRSSRRICLSKKTVHFIFKAYTSPSSKASKMVKIAIIFVYCHLISPPHSSLLTCNFSTRCMATLSS